MPTPLEFTTDGMGRVVPLCPYCERRKARRCLDCPAGVTGRRHRCPRCDRRANTLAVRRWRMRQRSEVRG